jgi:hypothetical protein
MRPGKLISWSITQIRYNFLAMDLDKANGLAWERTERYRHLQIGDKKVVTPYFSNEIGTYFRKLMEQAGLSGKMTAGVYELYKKKQIPFGWYRGKGTPEELEVAVVELARQRCVDIKGGSSAGIMEFMKQTGLGVDCSGFAYEILAFALGRDRWMKIAGRDRFHLGSSGFARRLSGELKKDKPGPLDLVLVKEINGDYGHVAVILERNSKLFIAQSTSTAVSPGVTTDELKMAEGKPVFGFIPSRGANWQQLYDQNRLEFRKLNI